MPDLGYTTIGTASSRSLDSTARGSTFSMTEDGTLQSVTAYIEDTATGDTFVAVVYNATTPAAATLVETSATRTDISTLGWYTFTMAGTTALTNGTPYWIAVGSNSAAGALLRHDVGTGASVGTFNPASPPASVDIDATADSRLYSTYLTYTTGGGEPPASGKAFQLVTSGLRW